MDRRGFITGIAGMLVARQAAAILPQGIIMPVRDIWVPDINPIFIPAESFERMMWVGTETYRTFLEMANIEQIKKHYPNVRLIQPHRSPFFEKGIK